MSLVAGAGFLASPARTALASSQDDWESCARVQDKHRLGCARPLDESKSTENQRYRLMSVEPVRYGVPAAARNEATAPKLDAAPAVDCAAAAIHWKTIAATTSTVVFEEYLVRFPSCFVTEARERIQFLKKQ